MKSLPQTNSFDTTPFFESSTRTRIRWDLFFIGLGITGTIGLVSIIMWGGYIGQVGLKTPVIPTTAATPIPSPTPTPIIWTRNTIKFSVLNGSGQAGKGSKIAGQLKSLGYIVNRIDLASKQAGSTLSLSGDIASLSAEIKKDLTGIVGEVIVKDQPESGTSKATLIIGSPPQ